MNLPCSVLPLLCIDVGSYNRMQTGFVRVCYTSRCGTNLRSIHCLDDEVICSRATLMSCVLDFYLSCLHIVSRLTARRAHGRMLPPHRGTK